MIMSYRKIDLKDLTLNPFTRIGKDWLLITAGTKERYNTMTASWGGVGVLWNKDVATIYIRPQRYTNEFVDANDTFSLTFFDETYKKALSFCGSKSGRDYDKAKETGLTPNFEYSAPTFEEGNLVFICKKIHAQTIDPACFLDADIEKNYPQKDYHTMYIGEILKAYVAE